MSKPDTPGELQNVNVDMISLVSKAANGERFKIFKSDKSAMGQAAGTGGETQTPETPPESVMKDERGLFHAVFSAVEKAVDKFFPGDTGNVTVQKGEVAQIISTQDKGQRLSRAIDALLTVLSVNRWGDGGEKAETDPKKIRAALTDFKSVAEDILIGKDDDVKKAVEEVQKSGRKISGPRLAKIKEVHAVLADLIAEADSKEGEASEVTKEELAQVVKVAVDEGLKPFSERLEKLEKGEGETNGGEGTQPATPPSTPPDQPDVGAVVKEAVAEAIAPLNERLEKVEKARGFSNKAPEETAVRKNTDGLWDGIF